MEIKKLRHAAILAEEGHFARAASRVHLTQSALSRSIQNLEQELGMRLFERQANGVSLTAGGRQFLHEARDLLRRASALQQFAHHLRDGYVGELAFGVGPVPAQLLLPPVLAAICQHYPRLQISAEIQPALRLQEWLLNEQIEFFIADTSQLARNPALAISPLLPLTGQLFVRRGHPLCQQVLTLDNLLQYPLASPGFADPAPHHHHPGEALPLLLQLSRRTEGHITCEDINTLITIARTSDAVVLMSTLTPNQQPDSALVALTQGEQELTWPAELSLVQLRGRELSPAAGQVIGLIHNYRQTLQTPDA